MKTVEQTRFIAGKEQLKALFEPKQVAVVGASRRPEAVGYAVLNNLLKGGYTGKIYPVNPKAQELENIPCFASVDLIPESIDLAILIVPAPAIAPALEQSAAKGAKAAIVISAGFREVGEEGLALEEEVIKIAEKNNMALLGPNCLGLISTDPNFSMNASFSQSMPARGNIAFVSQSGALCTAALDYAKGLDMGFSKFVSLGNKAQIKEVDVLSYLKDDPNTDVILMYLEDISFSRRFIEVVREITGDLEKCKPILAIKAGRTTEGAKAASSHTGSLMGSDEVYDAIFAQAGVIRINTVSEMFDLAVAFSRQPLPKSKQTAIVTNAGGPGIMATDACIRGGLTLAKFEEHTIERLKKALPSTASWKNPIDVIGDARDDRYAEAMRAAAEDPNVDSMIVILTPQAMTNIEKIAQIIVDVEKESDIPIIACFMGIVDVSKGVAILDEHKIPHYKFPENAARAMATMSKYQEWIKRPRTEVQTFHVERGDASHVIQTAKHNGLKFLPIHLSMDILKAYGFPVLPYGFATDAKIAGEVAAQVGFPVAIKAISQDVVHKVDLGAVQLNLKNKEEVKAACETILKNLAAAKHEIILEGFFVQAMAEKGREVILGMNRDPNLGPALMFGLGGVYVEALKDVTFRLAPIRPLGAKFMINSIRAAKLLDGVRNEPAADKHAIEDCLLRLSQLSCDFEEISEIDINPLMVYAKGKGAGVADARIILS